MFTRFYKEAVSGPQRVPNWSVAAGCAFAAVVAGWLLITGLFASPVETVAPVRQSVAVTAPPQDVGASSATTPAGETLTEAQVATRAAVAVFSGNWSGVPGATDTGPVLTGGNADAFALAPAVFVSGQVWSVEVDPDGGGPAALTTVRVRITQGESGPTYAGLT